MLVCDSAYVNTLTYENGGVTIKGSNNKKLDLDGTADRLRYYTNGSVQLYKLVESDNADLYAQTFLSTLQDNICSVTNEGVVETVKADRKSVV